MHIHCKQTSISNPALRRGGLLPPLIIPQAIVLALFIFDRYAVWQRIGAGVEWTAEGLARFFFELVTLGAGWAAMSLSALVASLAIHQGCAVSFYAKFVKAKFNTVTAEELADALSHERRRNGYMHGVTLVIAAAILVAGMGSVIGAVLQSSPTVVSVSMAVAALVAAFSWRQFSSMASNDDLGLEEVSREGDLLKGWSTEAFIAWEAAEAQGRLNHPNIKAFFDHRRAECLKNEEFVAELERCRARVCFQQGLHHGVRPWKSYTSMQVI